ncbi:MAG: spore cortex-lytic enzyme [Christensenellaceae bacterium]|jgi:N-acetylmuramoyl-L-alanine amidase|nr:spore cortex-lytic enzyme [Christensenellaceae bacterium]
MKGILRRVSALLLGLVLLLGQAQAATVYWGMSGENVRKVQQKLVQYGYLKGAVDGVFGQATYDAVVYFQKKNGLKADGVVGDATLAALGVNLGTSSSSSRGGSGSYSQSLNLLARLVYAEARGESYAGQVAVAAVVLNRVRSASFPNSVSGVIYQSGAFDVVYDGQINLSPNETALRAAQDALNGWDPSGGALYYYNPAKSTSSWIWSRRVITVIGKHRFAV